MASTPAWMTWADSGTDKVFTFTPAVNTDEGAYIVRITYTLDNDSNAKTEWSFVVSVLNAAFGSATSTCSFKSTKVKWEISGDGWVTGADVNSANGDFIICQTTGTTEPYIRIMAYNRANTPHYEHRIKVGTLNSEMLRPLCKFNNDGNQVNFIT